MNYHAGIAIIYINVSFILFVKEKPMEMISVPQMWALAMFCAGVFILSFCGKMEHKERQRRSSDKYKWEVANKKIKAEAKGAAGTLMTVLGGALALGGVIVFLANSNVLQ